MTNKKKLLKPVRWKVGGVYKKYKAVEKKMEKLNEQID